MIKKMSNEKLKKMNFKCMDCGEEASFYEARKEDANRTCNGEKHDWLEVEG